MNKTLLLVTVGTVALATPALAQTQPQPDTSEKPAAAVEAPAATEAAPGDDIVVTGFRGSLVRAANIKRSEATISDVIAAEDIGKYPDTNIAESLQRVTGVQITRNRGSGSTISVRGLSPSFVSTQLNGRQIVNGQGRTFDFLSLSPDFVSAVVVQKSPTASMIEGGLSGTVDVRTARPLEVGKNTIAGRVEGTYDDLRGAVSPRVSVIGNLVNKDHTFGISLGAGYERQVNRVYAQQSFGAETATEASKGVDYNRDGDLNDTYTYDHAQAFVTTQGVRERYSAISGFQWKPSDTFELYGDGLWTQFNDSADQLNGAVRFTNIAPSAPGAKFGAVSSTIDTSFVNKLLGGSQGFLTTLDADGVDLRADRQPFANTNIITSGALGAKFNSGRFHLNVEGTFSHGIYDQSSQSASAIARASVQITRPGGLAGQPQLTFTRGFNPLDPNNFSFTGISRNLNNSSDRIASGKADLTYDVGGGILKDIKAGVYYSDRHLYNQSFTSNVDAATSAQLGGFAYRPTVESGSISAAPFLTQISTSTVIPRFLPSNLVFDYDKYFSALGGVGAVNKAAPYIEQLGSELNVRERTFDAYAQLDLGDTNSRVSGNVGARYVHTNLTSTGFGTNLDNLSLLADNTTTIVAASGALSSKNSYNYVLPSFNLLFNVSDRFVTRFAAARVLSRPDFNQLGVGLSVDANVRSISAANPDLKPYLANQVDLSFEYYLPHSGLLSLAFFYKNVENFIVNGQVLESHPVRKVDGSTVTLDFRRNLPINLETVNIKGIEVGYQVPLDLFVGALNGFGVFGNGTYVDAPEVPAEENGLPFLLPGVSKFSYNVGGFFEKWGLGARAYYNWRSKYDTGNANYFGDRDYQLPYGQLDGSVSYDVTKFATVSFDFENVTGAAIKEQNNFGLARGWFQNPRRFTFGVRARF